MKNSHPLIQAVLSNIADADNSPMAAKETISSALGIGQREDYSENPTTLPQVILHRIHNGDWVFSLTLDFLHKDRVNAIQAALKGFMTDPRVALNCKYDTDEHGNDLVRISIDTWIGENAPSQAKAFLDTGLLIDLVLKRQNGMDLKLTHIDVDARHIYTKYQTSQNQTE